MKEAAVIIPNLNGMAYLEGCLKSLEQQTEKSFTTVMIDNGSTDGSASYVRERFPWVRVRAFHQNTGFCRAVNEGIRMTREPFVILLNNDTRCAPDFVGQLLAAIREREDCFSCSAKMLSMAEPEKIDDAGDLYCALGWAFARGKGKDSRLYQRPCRVFASCGGAAIYRRSALKQVGLFDEHHFAYLEDIDLGWRARIFGYSNWYAPGAIVWHQGSAASGSRYNSFKVTHTARNSVWLLYKNMPRLQLYLNLPLLLAGFGIKALFFRRRGLGRDYLKGLCAGLRGRGQLERVRVRREHLGNYLRIQLELMVNVIRRLAV